MRSIALVLVIILSFASGAEAIGRLAAPPAEQPVVHVEVELVVPVPYVAPVVPPPIEVFYLMKGDSFRPRPFNGPPMPPHRHPGPCANPWMLCPGQFWEMLRIMILLNLWQPA